MSRPGTVVSFPGHYPEMVPAPRSGEGVEIRIQGLGKSFGDKTVLRGLDLHIRAGEFVAVVGHSGCG